MYKTVSRFGPERKESATREHGVALEWWINGVMESMKSQTLSTKFRGFRCQVSGFRWQKKKNKGLNLKPEH
jgi:hypothetical protein